MSADLVGVVYSTVSLMARSIIIPESGDGLEDAALLAEQQNPPLNCAIAVIQRAGLKNLSLDTVLAAINAEQGLGLLPQLPCAFVDNKGVVQNIALADPAHLPFHNGHRVVHNKVGAGKGDQWDGTHFKRHYAIANRNRNLVVSTEHVTLPEQPKLNDRQRAHVNNDQSLKVGDIVGVVEIK